MHGLYCTCFVANGINRILKTLLLSNQNGGVLIFFPFLLETTTAFMFLQIIENLA